MIPKISIVTTCKGRLDFLKQTLPHMVAQTDSEVIVVDYDCPDGTGVWVREYFPQVRVVAVQAAPHFVGARARNLGAAQAQAPWLCFVDADILLDSEFSRHLLPQLKEGCFYQAHPTPRQMVGTVVLHINDFSRFGGYDEVIAGWGGEDMDMYGRLMLHGMRRVSFPVALLRDIPHSDELRTANREITNIQISHRVATLYGQAKLDVMRLLGRDISLEERTALFWEIHDTVAKTPPDSSPQIEVTLPSQGALILFGGPCEMERKLVLRLKPANRPS